jgi:hypothetical protein
MTGLVLWENRVSQGSKVSSVFFIAISLQFALLAETFPAIRFPPEYGVGKPPWREVGDKRAAKYYLSAENRGMYAGDERPQPECSESPGEDQGTLAGLLRSQLSWCISRSRQTAHSRTRAVNGTPVPKPNGCETNNAIRPGRRRCVPRR